MRKLGVALACAATVVGAFAMAGTATVRAGGEPAEAAFRLADGSAACAFADGRVACRTASMDEAAVLEPDGTTSIADAPVSWDAQTPVLRTTESWWHADFTCRVVDERIACYTLDGATIAVGKGELAGAAPPAFATLP